MPISKSTSSTGSGRSGPYHLSPACASFALAALALFSCLVPSAGVMAQQDKPVVMEIKPVEITPPPATKPAATGTTSSTFTIPPLTLSKPNAPSANPAGPLTVGSGTPTGKWGVMGVLKSTCGGLTANGTLQDPCGPTPAKFEAEANVGCSGDAFAAQGSCWTCPQGFSRNALYKADSARACSRSDSSAQAEFFEAKFAGGRCPDGSFRDVGRNECWSCPAGFARTANGLLSANACIESTGPLAQRRRSEAAFVQKAECQPGEIADPRNGGECWACPVATGRTTFPVNGPRACQAAGGIRFASATQGEIRACAPGQIHDLANASNANVANRIRAQYGNNVPANVAQSLGKGTHGTCWSCPADTKRSWFPVWNDKACKAQTIGIVPAPYAHPGLFGLAGGEQVALALIKERTQIESIARAIAGETKQAPEAAVRDTWDDIARAPQSSLVLQTALFARIQSAATEPQKGSADEARLRDSFAGAIRAYRTYMAQTSLDAYNLWSRTDALARGQRDANNLISLFDYGVPPPDLEKLSAAGIFGGIGANAAASVAMGQIMMNPAIRKIIFPYRKVATKVAQKVATKVAEKVAEESALKLGQRIATEVAAKAAGSMLAVIGSAGPQIIITIAVEMIAGSIEQIVDIATAKPKLETKLRIATAAVDIARMMQTDEGDGELDNQWSLAITGRTAPARMNEFASLAAANMAAPMVAAAKSAATPAAAPAAGAAAAPQFDIVSATGTCLRAQAATPGAPVGLAPCLPAGHRWISASGELKPDNARCLSDGAQLTAAACAPLAAGQPAPPPLNWDYKPANGQIVNQAGRCLEARGFLVVSAPCNAQPAQKWVVRQ